MPGATQRRTLRHKNLSFVISTTGKTSALTVNGKPISVVKMSNNKFRTRYLPHAEFKDVDTLARALIEVYPSTGAARPARSKK
jgi:hypothetical protein